MRYAQKKTKTSVFGKDVDERCHGYNFFEKFLVVVGILADEEQNKRFGQIDRELDQRKNL